MAIVIENVCAFCEKEFEEITTMEALKNYDHDLPSCCNDCVGRSKVMSPLSEALRLFASQPLSGPEAEVEAEDLEDEFFEEEEEYQQEECQEEGPFGGAFSSMEDYYSYRGIKADY